MKIARQLLFVLMCSQALSATAQEKAPDLIQKNEQSGEYSYTAIKEVPNVAAEVMYKRAKAWILANLKTIDNNTNFDDKQLTINNGSTLLLDNKDGFGWRVYNTVVNFKISLQFKDGRYKITINQIIIVESQGGITPYDEEKLKKWPKKAANYAKGQVNDKIRAMVKELYRAIKADDGSDKW